MANYNADIQIAVKGKSQLNQLESQLKRTQKVLNQLNKQLNFRAKVQAIRLDTRQANTAISNLEKRINRLGRTINVNLRVNEKEGSKSKSSNSFGIATSGNQGQVAAALAASTKKQVAQTQQLTRLESSRSNAQDELIAQKQQLNDLVEQRIALEKKLNAVANSANEKAQTANRNRLFGGEVSKAGNKLSPKQAEQAAKARVAGLDRQIEKLGRTVQSTETKFDKLSQATSYWAGNERRRVMKAADAWDRYQRKVDAAAKKRQRIGNFKKGAGVGLGAAAFNIPGLGGVASGALGGAAVGGKAGAIAGGLTAAVLEASVALIAFGNDAAKTAAQISKLELALENVTGGGENFEQALAAIRDVVDDYNTPLDDATAQFTKLTAAGQASGFTIKELEDVYKGLAAANKALGGDSERLSGILLATTQVFSKGKVQAEELRGQIGERLPGAFALFAKATGRTTKELDKALNNGEVSLEDFITFARDLFETYDKDAQVIADSPEEAGARLTQAMTDLKNNVGGELAALGARFQDFATAAIQALDSVFDKLGRLGREIEARLGGLPTDEIENAAERLRRAQNNLQNARNNNNQIGIEIFGRAVSEASNDLYGVFTPPTTPPSSSTTPDAPKTGGSSSGGGAARKSRVPELQRELALQQELYRLEGLMNQAELESNQRELIRLDTQMKLAELAKREQDIRASDAPDNEKVLQILRNQLDVERAAREEKQQLALLDQARKTAVDELVTASENELALLNAETELARELLTIEQEMAALRGDKSNNFSEEDINRIKQARTNLALVREEQRQYNELLAAAQPFADAFATGITSGLQEIVRGTKTAEEAFADFLNNIADLLIQTAATMIAQYIAIGIAKAFAGLGGAQYGSGQGSLPGIPGSVSPQGLPYYGPAFAEGGFVTGPTSAIVGEGGEPEYIIPASKMAGAMQRYSGGVRGDAVIDGPEGNQVSSGGLALADAPISISTGPVMQFEGTNYVTQEEFARGVQSAAKQGEQRALRRLQSSPGQRRKLGL